MFPFLNQTLIIDMLRWFGLATWFSFYFVAVLCTFCAMFITVSVWLCPFFFFFGFLVGQKQRWSTHLQRARDVCWVVASWILIHNVTCDRKLTIQTWFLHFIFTKSFILALGAFELYHIVAIYIFCVQILDSFYWKEIYSRFECRPKRVSDSEAWNASSFESNFDKRMKCIWFEGKTFNKSHYNRLVINEWRRKQRNSEW